MGIQKEIKGQRCIIVAGGDMEDLTFFKQQLRLDDYIICADSGLRYVLQAGIHPDAVIGDFDSYTEPLPKDCEIIRLPTHKDDTDLLAAAKLAVERGYKDIVLFAVMGSRPDQSFAALQNLAEIGALGVHISVCAKHFRAFVISNTSVKVQAHPGTYLSVFAFGGPAKGVTITGAEYPLQNYNMAAYSSIGVSNHVLNGQAEVAVKDGTLLIWLVNEK